MKKPYRNQFLRIRREHWTILREGSMSSLAETISNALAAIGPATEDRLRDMINDFEGMNLSAEERLSAIASAVAAIAHTHHGKHKPVYLDAVKAWSLEIAGELQPPPIRLRRRPDPIQVEEAAEILIAGIDGLIELMSSQAVRTQDRLIAELAVVSRLLGQNDANTIHMTLRVVTNALETGDYRPGEIVAVPLREAALPLTREASLAALAPRGCA
jgi:hypothetical protein